MREFCQQLYGNTFENLDKIDIVLEKYNLLELTQKETENLKQSLNSPVKETEAIVIQNKTKQKTSVKKTPVPDGFKDVSPNLEISDHSKLT